jgi:GT2 family glycosyltransferase
MESGRTGYVANEQGHLSREPTHAVIIVTWRRPAYVKACLNAIFAGSRLPEQVIVVDASEDSKTKTVVGAFPSAQYVNFPGGAGHMTTARNEGLRHVRATVVSFIDDDVKVGREWALSLMLRFSDSAVDALAGRTRNGEPGETDEGKDCIGRVLPDGRVTGNFAADPGLVIPVDHGIGANMSFRSSIVASLGGFRDNFPGTSMREDTDIFLRIAALGGRAVFDPAAVVDNNSAPHVRGRRFDVRYAYFAERNHVQMLAMNYGLRSPVMRRYLLWTLSSLRSSDVNRRFTSRVLRAVVRIVGLIAGFHAGLRNGGWRKVSPVRRDAQGEALRQVLSSVAS